MNIYAEIASIERQLGVEDGGKMEAKELLKLKPELKKFLKRFDDCIQTRASRKHLMTYVSGQLGNLERKSAEPIALAASVPPRTLQEFLSIHNWNDNMVLRRVMEIVEKEHSVKDAIGVIDETGFPKKGKKTPGVERQYCGETGKIDNCVVTVNLGYVADNFHCLVNSEVYFPKNWIDDKERRIEAKVPDGLKFRTKIEIALDLLRESVKNGLKLSWVSADELYGRSSDFRKGVVELSLNYVVEVPCSIQGWLRRPRSVIRKAKRIDKLWVSYGASWQMFRVKDTERGPEIWNVRAARFFPHEDQRYGEEGWLLAAQNVLSGEVKYFLSSAPSDTPVETMLRVAFNRWHIERIFEDGKGEVGMGHFEVRNYLSLKRHLIITMLSFLFLAGSTNRLKKWEKKYYIMSGKKSGRSSIGTRVNHKSTNAQIGNACKENELLAKAN